MTEPDARSVRVSAGVVRRDGRVLVCRRRGDQQHPHKWEFPGGKMEEGESPEACLRRELREELGVEATIGGLIARTEHSYPGGPRVRLWFFAVEEIRGALRNRVFAEIRWVEPRQLASIDLLDADRPLVDLLARPSNRR